VKGCRVGITLPELLTVLVILGILASLTAPSFTRMIARMQRVAALNQLAADVYHTRMLAVRWGVRTELRLLNEGGCSTRLRGRRAANAYRIVVHTRPERTVKEVRALDLGRGVCFEHNNDATLLFNSRGLPVPFENRTVWARRGPAADSLTFSVLGRVLRRY